MDLLQNRSFVRGFRRFSWHVTKCIKCHACHGICTLSPLRAALTTLTTRFAENTPHDTSKVLRLPRKMTSEVSKVLCLPQKMQHIFWKRSKSIAPATENDFWRVLKHVGMPQSATPATQSDMTTSSDTSKKSRFCDFSHRHGNFEATTAADGRLRTVAEGCGRLRTLADARSRVTRTLVNPQTPKCKTRTLRYAFGKNGRVKTTTWYIVLAHGTKIERSCAFTHLIACLQISCIFYLFIYLLVCICLFMHCLICLLIVFIIYLSIYLFIYLSIYLFIYFIFLPICIYFCLFISWSIQKLCVYLCLCLYTYWFVLPFFSSCFWIDLFINKYSIYTIHLFFF